MEIISRKGGGLPRDYAENRSWLNSEPWRVFTSEAGQQHETLPTAEPVPGSVMSEEAESAGTFLRRSRKRSGRR